MKHNCVTLFTIPTTFGIAHAHVRMLHSQGTGCLICNLCQIIATRQLDAFTVPSSHYVSNNRIYVRSHLFVGTDSIAIDVMTMEDWLFSQHRPPTILPFLLVGCCDCRWSGDCAMTLVFHVLRKMSHKNTLQFISTFGRNGTLSLEYLGPVAVFQQNINLREAAQTSSRNIAHSARMQESDARHTLKCDIYEFNRVRNRWYRYATFQ